MGDLWRMIGRNLLRIFSWHGYTVLSQAEERLAQMEKSLEQLRREVHSGVAQNECRT